MGRRLVVSRLARASWRCLAHIAHALHCAVVWVVIGPRHTTTSDPGYVPLYRFLNYRASSIRGYIALGVGLGVLSVSALNQARVNTRVIDEVSDVRANNIVAICQGFDRVNRFVYKSAVRSRVRYLTDPDYRRLLGPRLINEALRENVETLIRFRPGHCDLNIDPGQRIHLPRFPPLPRKARPQDLPEDALP